MMAKNMSSASDIIALLPERDFYFGLDESGEFILFSMSGHSGRVSLSDEVAVSHLASSIHHFVTPDRVAFSWGAKDVFSAVRKTSQMPMEIPCPVYDLSLACSYLSIDGARPYCLRDAKILMRRVLSHPGWASFAPFYREVYLPLLSRVLPDVENCCLVDNSRRACVYPFYVMEGQANGRLKALCPSESNYNPHSMGLEARRSLAPPGYEQEFVCFDYRNMEVCVLQWLSGDPDLGAILASGDDPYSAIWARVIGAQVSDAHRSICKEVFLPVVFGQGARSLASKIGRTEEFASRIIDRLVGSFPVAFDWVKSQSPDGDKLAVDCFGRRRAFEEFKLYKIRNFAVQSPASMICLRKLVRLYEAVSGIGRVCFHVHDGYSVVCEKDEVDSVFEAGRSALEEEDSLFPGLRLRVSCRSGSCLETLKPIETEIKI